MTLEHFELLYPGYKPIGYGRPYKGQPGRNSHFVVISPEARVPGRSYFEYMNSVGCILLIPTDVLEKG